MLENEEKQTDLLDTTDNLEAIGVFKAMKNFLFVVSMICLLLLQVIFWVTDRGFVKYDEAAPVKPLLAAESVVAQPEEPAESAEQLADVAAKAASSLKDKAAGKTEQPQGEDNQTQEKDGFGLKFSTLAWAIRFFDIVLVFAAVLYCLSILFSLKISLVGRLGGINHISRAFFLSLFMLVFLLPWQKLFGGVVAGAVYTPEGLLAAVRSSAEESSVIWVVIYYLRFIALWVIVVLLSIFAQVCSVRWSRATLRRLEVI